MADLRTELKRIREDVLRVSQSKVVAMTGNRIALQSYQRAEKGDTVVSRRTALEILDAINSLLREQGKPSVTLVELDLKMS